jgi:hypothetical protein
VWFIEVIIFDSVYFYIKKVIKLNFFFKKIETGSNRPVSVRFLWQKPVQTVLVRFFLFGSVLDRFFPVWLGFFPVWLVFFGLGSVRFFQFQAYKTKTNRTGWFYQNFNRIFSQFDFFNYFFFNFFSLVSSSVLFSPTGYLYCFSQWY